MQIFIGHFAAGFVRNQDVGSIYLVRPLQARPEIHGITDYRVAFRNIRTHRADDHLACRNTDPKIDIEIASALAEFRHDLFAKFTEMGYSVESSLAGQRRMGVLRGERRPPERHDRIAHELVDHPVVIRNCLRHVIEEPVDHPHEFVWAKLFRDRREPLQVDEHDRHFAALPALLGNFRRIEQTGDDTGIEIFAERILDPLLQPQFPDHVIERVGQRSDLVMRRSRH